MKQFEFNTLNLEFCAIQGSLQADKIEFQIRIRLDDVRLLLYQSCIKLSIMEAPVIVAIILKLLL